jgi:hypothetical protein
MSDTAPEPPEPADEPPAAPFATRHRLLPWLTGVGLVILAAGLIWVWQHPAVPPPATEQTDALAHQLGMVEARMTRLEQRPPPQSPDLGPLSARVAALEQRPITQDRSPASAPDLAPLEQRLAVLEQRQQPNLGPLEARIAALENAQRTMRADLSRQLEAVEGRLAANEKASRRIPLVQAAALALAAGQKLGDLPGAPPALARFGDTNPPTEATLRLAFPPAARAALAVAHPAADDKPLLTRLWSRAQDLVTVRQGDRVLLGDPAAGVLEQARTALDAGDLAAATAAVATLQGAAAQAMAAWLAQARSLLEARAALAAWAASG